MQMMKKFFFPLSVIASAAILAGCAAMDSKVATAARPTQAAVTAAAMLGTPLRPQPILPTTPGTPLQADVLAVKSIDRKSVAKRATRSWHGARTVDVQDDEVLPPVFNETVKWNFDDSVVGGRVSIATVAERISRVSGVTVRVKADVYSSGGTGPNRSPAPPQAIPSSIASSSPTPFPVGGPPGAAAPAVSAAPISFNQPITDVSSVEMRWTGTLAGFLNHTTARLGLSWSYRDGIVLIERFITETFEMTTFGGDQDYKMSLSGGNSGGSSGSSASASMSMSEGGKLAILESLRQAIDSMVKPAGGTVVLNEGTGRFFVQAPKDVMTRVRSIIKAEDASLQRQALIQFDIYSVVSNNANEAGVDWTVVLQNLTKTIGASLRSPATLTGSLDGTLGFNILSGNKDSDAVNKIGNSAVLLKLLNQVGNNALHRPISMVALNRQWARKTNLNTDGYLSETTPSTSSAAGSGAPGLKTSSITTGDKVIVQPAIMDNGTIMLKFGISLSELLGLFDQTAGSGATLQKVQTPNTSGTDDQGTIRLNPGESMVVTGLSRRKSISDQRTLGESIPVGVGGSRTQSYKREDFLIVVRAVQL
jgi:type IVB pilus formation R64 PilN family outer membrane protein